MVRHTNVAAGVSPTHGRLGPRLGWYEFPVPSIPVKGSPDMGGLSALQQVADAFGLGAVTRVQVVPEGLMNRNWRVATATGAWAVKQVLDVDAAAAPRHRGAGPHRPAHTRPGQGR
jgi:hypothetical protein